MKLSRNSHSTMETEIILKNKVSLKSRMSKGNLFSKAILFLIGICFTGSLWGQTYKFIGKTSGALYYSCELIIDLNNNTVKINKFLGLGKDPQTAANRAMGEKKYQIDEIIYYNKSTVLEDFIGVAFHLDENDNNQILVDEKNVATFGDEKLIYSGSWSNWNELYQACYKKTFGTERLRSTKNSPSTSSTSKVQNNSTNYSPENINYYRKEAEQGNSLCKYILANCYWLGEGVTQDYNSALYWYERALKNEDRNLNESHIADIKKYINMLKDKGYSSSRANVSTTTPSTTNSQPPSGKIERVWLEHNVYKNGEKGMNVHAHFFVKNMKGVEIDCSAAFYFYNGKQSDVSFGGSSFTFTLASENSEYKDYVFFVPYDFLQFILDRDKIQNFDMKTKISLREILGDTIGRTIAESDYVSFTYNNR